MDPADNPDQFATHVGGSACHPARIGNYETLKLIGAGAMGRVLLARHSQFSERQYAIKLLKSGPVDEDLLQRFQREIRVTGSFQHPNLIYAHDAGVTPDGELYLVMEYVPGVDLQQALAQVGQFDVPAAAALMVQACAGLHCAHSKSIVHRDIKPSNLLLTQQGVVKVSDLGLAGYLEQNPGQGQELMLTAAHTVLGTPHFMAPEIWGDPRAASTQSDIYATACTLYSLLTGNPPFAKYNSLPQLMQAHRSVNPPPLTELGVELPPDMAEIIASALEKRIEDRPQSCEEFRHRLLPFAGELSTLTMGQFIPSGQDRYPQETHRDRANDTQSTIAPSTAERQVIQGLSTWTVNEKEKPIVRRIIIAIACLLSLCILSLVMAYYGPGSTPAWRHRFDLLADRPVPLGSGFLIELIRAVIMLGLTTIVLSFRFNHEVTSFWSLKQWNLKLIANRLAALVILGLFLGVEANRHLNLEKAPAELAAWATEHGIDTTAAQEQKPYRWYLLYSLVIYTTQFCGLVAIPLIRFTLSDFPILIRRLRELRVTLATANSGSVVSRVLLHFAKECRELSTRYVDVMAVLVIGVHYDWWVGWRTLSESAQAVLMIAWGVAGLAIAFFVTITGLYARAYDAAFTRVVSFGSVSQEAEISKINTLWFLRKNLLDSLSGLICLSVCIVLLRALLS